MYFTKDNTLPNLLLRRARPQGRVGKPQLGELEIWLPGDPRPGPRLVTLERPWVDNKPFASCIPEGIYQLQYDANLQKTLAEWRVRDVYNRTGIEFHALNVVEETHGCIGLGLQNGIMSGETAIFNSQKACRIFNRLLAPYRDKLLPMAVIWPGSPMYNER